jgi:hypothetical protein
MGVDVTPPDSGVVILSIYDSNDSNISGKLILAIIHADAGMSGISHEFFAPVAVNRGIYVSVTGAGINYNYIIRYSL